MDGLCYAQGLSSVVFGVLYLTCGSATPRQDSMTTLRYVCSDGMSTTCHEAMIDSCGVLQAPCLRGVCFLRYSTRQRRTSSMCAKWTCHLQPRAPPPVPCLPSPARRVYRTPPTLVVPTVAGTSTQTPWVRPLCVRLLCCTVNADQIPSSRFAMLVRSTATARPRVRIDGVLCGCDLFPSGAGIEGHDSCFILLSNSTGAFTNVWGAQEDCKARGGHLLTTAATALYQGGVLDAALAVYLWRTFYVGAYR